MEKLAVDTIENIFNRLPIEAALHAKHVCKSWEAALHVCSITSHKVGFFFAFSFDTKRSDVRKELFYEDEYDHYNHRNNNYYHSKTLRKIQHDRFITESVQRVIMVGSCNGLVCFAKYNKEARGTLPFLICNPLTGESVFLPEYNYSELLRGNGKRISYRNGFGYCPSTNKYKVVIIYDQEYNKGHAQVYTIGGGEWRCIGLDGRYNHYRFDYFSSVYDYFSSVYANGALHWLHQGDPKVQNYEVGVFDLKEEKLHYVSFPCFQELGYNDAFRLLGNVNLYLVHRNCSASRTDIWLYRGNNINTTGTNECSNSSSRWTKQFSIEFTCPYFAPFAITRNNHVLLWQSTRYGTRLGCYGTETSTFYGLWNDDTVMEYDYIEAIPHRQSVVSLKGLGE